MADTRFFDEDEDGESTRAQDMLGLDPSHVRYDFTGSISGFDFPPDVELGFDSSILASSLDFGAGMSRNTRYTRAELAERSGSEDEAFERDEEYGRSVDYEKGW